MPTTTTTTDSTVGTVGQAEVIEGPIKESTGSESTIHHPTSSVERVVVTRGGASPEVTFQLDVQREIRRLENLRSNARGGPTSSDR